jgi:hypothetical protein
MSAINGGEEFGFGVSGVDFAQWNAKGVRDQASPFTSPASSTLRNLSRQPSAGCMSTFSRQRCVQVVS